jgi:hypothetical protein
VRWWRVLGETVIGGAIKADEEATGTKIHKEQQSGYIVMGTCFTVVSSF